MIDVTDYNAAGDGQTDDTGAIYEALREGDGALRFPRGDYIISETIEVPLDEAGRTAIVGEPGATVIMIGKGPAFRLVGTHEGTGSPTTVDEAVWRRQRMPTVGQIAVTAENDEADGFELIETMQALFHGVWVRQARHGIRLTRRNRNTLISDCHLYHNTGVGLFIDRCNLHQINVSGSHISYNRLGGIRVAGSQLRNLQISGCDIEYNNHRVHNTAPRPTAEIFIDCTGSDPSNPSNPATAAEIAITGSTIQATASEEGANIRILGTDLDRRIPPRLITIAGNVIGSQTNNVHLTAAEAVTITGNTIYSAADRNIRAENCRQLMLGSNSFRRHTDDYGAGVRLERCRDTTITGCHFSDESESGQASGASLLELAECVGINITGCQLSGGVPFGVDASRCRRVNLSACTIDDGRDRPAATGAVRFTGEGEANIIAGCIFSGASKSPLHLDDAADVSLAANHLGE